MTLDMKTALVAVIFIIVICLVVMLQLWYQNRTKYSGLNLWVACCILLVGGTLMIALRHKIPDWASVVLSNSMIVCAPVALYFGLCRFAGKKTNPWLYYSIWIVFALFVFVHSYFTFIHDDYSARIFNTAAGLLLGGCLCLWLMLKGMNPEIRHVARSSGIALAVLLFIVFLGTIGLALQPPGSNELFQSGWFEILMAMLLACSTAFITFNMALMVNRRINAEARQMESAIKQSESELRATFQTTSVGFAIVTQRIVKEMNEAGCAMLGYSREELIGKDTRMFYLSDEAYRSAENLYTKIPESGTVTAEVQVRRKNGQIMDAIMNISALDKNNMSSGVVISIVDITERKRAEETVRELYEKEKALREELEKEAKARAMFIDILAHELKTPLTPVLASAELLNEVAQQKNDEIIQKLAANIYSSSGILNKRLGELLDMARYARGTFKLNPELTNMSDFIRETVSRYRPTLEQSHQTLIVQVENNLPEIYVDPSRLEQVMVNLLSNASKFSPPGSKILLTVKRTKDMLRIGVKDSGIGINEEEQKNLFEPYHRVLQDRNKYPGTGLGLAICKQIVSSHGGKIWVESENSRGSTFIFEIPMREKFWKP